MTATHRKRATPSAPSCTDCSHLRTTSSRNGGLRVIDTSTGVTFLPGCCDGLESWRDWHQLDDGKLLGFGHEPVSPVAEHFGDTVRLTVNTKQRESPVITLSVTEFRHRLAGAERDLADFLALAADWTARHLPAYRTPVMVALAGVLDLPVPAVRPES
ncbi:hypothetical protein [Streptomyces sp. NPDC055210]